MDTTRLSDIRIKKQLIYTLSFVLLAVSRILFEYTYIGDVLGERFASVLSDLLLVSSLLLLAFVALFHNCAKLDLVFFFLCAGLIGLSLLKSRATNLFISFLFLFFAGEIRNKKQFAWVVIWLFAAIIGLMVLLSVSGKIGMTVKQRASNDMTRFSLGFTHPNQLAIMVYTILCMVFFIDAEKKNVGKYMKYVVSGVLVLGVFLITNTFTFLALSMLLMATSFVYDALLSKAKLPKRDAKRFIRVGLIVLSIVAGVAIVYIWQDPYRLSGSFKTLRTRFVLCQKYVNAYGIKLFGNKILIGTDVAIPNYPVGYYYLDNGYVRLFVESGLVPGIMVMLAFARMIRKLIAKTKWQFLIIVSCLLVYLFNEQKMITVFFNPMWLLMREYMLPDRRRNPSALLSRYIHALRQQNPERNKGGEW